MLIPHARARRAVVALLAAATLASCGSHPSGGPQSTDAGASRAPSPSAFPASPTDSASPAASQSASSSPSSKPSASKTQSTAAAPPGANYADRLPKFDRPPKADKVHLPEGASVPYYARIPTEQAVAFITIDDGQIKRPEALELIKQAGVPVTLFLMIDAIRNDPPYFKRLQDAGAVIEAHTVTHQNLKGKSYTVQRREICDSADKLGQWYGRRPVLFRPPYGDKDDTTLKAAHDCGMHAAFFWKETVDKGIVRYQSGNTVQRGDIILMHFRDRFVDDFIAALQAIKAAGLTPALLEDYIP
ncbi:polysaccharide deacetylase family protein [Dactylosporangium sp. NBC_01737]|uniref:polysaccharide deacetylase family protein n=1 Tax=Dactylosporangium sp. NBC_01737 TaxID=2975959 RepID=UPI002E0F8568|nr:polysaccharide deacetylase family protein [Dactylosporangium sp. NBC_01737]